MSDAPSILLLVWLGWVASGCALEEQDGFLVGRRCDRGIEGQCDEGQVCLPHRVEDGVFDDFMCRDEASFSSSLSDAPLAFCDDTLPCPGELICRADRIRFDAGIRRQVCKAADDPFAPPIDAGTGT